MTLLGKLFRPWDLSEEDPSEDSKIGFESIISSKDECDKICSQNQQNYKRKRQFNFGDTRDLAKSSNNYNLDNLCNSPASSPKVEAEESETTLSDIICSKSVTSQENIDKCTLEYELNSLYNSSLVHNQGSPMFLHPSAVNDLAKLSRNELTAMGLLPPEPPSAMKIKRQRPKRFHCPHCQVAFSNNGQLRGHIRIHTGERPFTCDQEGCGKSFTRNEELTRHRRIHSGLRPYPCTYCGKKFGRKDHLKKHTRTHQRPLYTTAGGMIGFGNPFHPFNPPLMSTHSSINDFNSTQSPYGLPFVLSVPPPISHFPFS